MLAMNMDERRLKLSKSIEKRLIRSISSLGFTIFPSKIDIFVALSKKLRDFIMNDFPKPKKLKKLQQHGDIREDWYYWLRDDNRSNKEIINYLNEENKYTKKWFKENSKFKKIFNFYKNSIPKFEESFKTKMDSFRYFSTASINQEYRKYYRIFKKKRKLILDVNKLAKNKEYYDISGIYPSKNHKYLAYGQDETGRREFSIIVKNIEKNKILDKNLCSSSGNIIWNNNSSGYFYFEKRLKTLITNSLFFTN